MKLRSHFLLALLLFVSAMVLAQTPHYQSHFPPEEFKARWATIFDKIGDRAVAREGRRGNEGVAGTDAEMKGKL